MKYILIVSLIILLNIYYLINAKCTEDEGDQWTLICSSKNLEEVNNQTNKDKYKSLEISGLNIKRFESRINYPSVTRLHITNCQKLEEITSNILSNLDALQYLTIDFTVLSKIRQKSFDSLFQLKELILNSNRISRIESGSFDVLTDLIMLDLSHNKIQDLKSGLFDSLNNLQIMKLNSNEIQVLSTDIFLNLYNIKECDLSYNKLKFIADNTFQTIPLISLVNFQLVDSSLEVLHLSGNSIEKITNYSFNNLPKLKTLELNQNNIQEIAPNAFTDLINLEMLDISVNPIRGQINQINFGKLKKLKLLSLTLCEIKHLDGNIFKPLESLTDLQLGSNQIEDISLDMFNYTDRLRELSLYSNKIKYISSSTFDNLHLLKTLDLGYNQIAEIESGSFLQLKSLISLKLFGNKLKDIKVGTFDLRRSSVDSDVSSRLITLNLGSNQLSKLTTDAFDPLVNLNHFFLLSNKIEDIPNNFFRKMTKLKTLLLGYNKLANLPETVFEPLGGSLLKLELQSNKFEYINPKIFKPLQQLVELNLKQNMIKVIDDQTFNLPSLKKVNVHSNQLTYLSPNLLHGDDCVVQEFSVYGNRLTFIEDNFFDNTTLKSFQFGRNPWICKCLDNMIDILNAKQIKYYAKELSGGQPSCVTTLNNTCVHDLNNSEELFKQYNIILQQYPFMCTNPDLC